MVVSEKVAAIDEAEGGNLLGEVVQVGETGGVGLAVVAAADADVREDL